MKLGLLPGAGGTQRLPRVIGVERGAQHDRLRRAAACSKNCAARRCSTPSRDGDLLAGALAFRARAHSREGGAQAGARSEDRRCRMPRPTSNLRAIPSRPQPARIRRPWPASRRSRRRSRSPSRPASSGSASCFTTLMLSPESAALRHIFQAERAASHIADVPDDTPRASDRKVGVIGAGTMGGGITMSLINAGLPVVLLETTQEALDRGLATIRRNYQGALQEGQARRRPRSTKRLALITPTLDYAPLQDVDLVIEAVFENMDVKRQVFRELDAVVRAGAILASNTSALNLDEIANFTQRPQDVIGLHFFSPANVMRLLEIVRGAKTAKDVLATAMRARQDASARSRWSPGSATASSAIACWPVTARPRTICSGRRVAAADRPALQEFGMAMGPFRMSDLAGLDIGWAAAQAPRRRESGPRLLQRRGSCLCEAGRFGQKTGAGWYRYEAGSRAAHPGSAGDRDHREVPPQPGITPRKVTNEEIVRALHLCADQRRRAHPRGRHRAAQLRHRHRVSQRLWLSRLARRTDVLCRPDRPATRWRAPSSASRPAAAATGRVLDSRRRCSRAWRRRARPSAQLKGGAA